MDRAGSDESITAFNIDGAYVKDLTETLARHRK